VVQIILENQLPLFKGDFLEAKNQKKLFEEVFGVEVEFKTA